MVKKKKKNKKGAIMWYSRLWEPHGHKRTSSKSGLFGGITSRTRGGGCCGGRGCCGWGCFCILLLVFMFGIGGFGGLGGFEDTDGGSDDDVVRYYQLTVLVALEGGENLMAHELAYSPVLYNVTVYPASVGGMIEHFVIYEDILGKSAYDYVNGYGLYVEIFNDDLNYYTDGYVISGIDNSFTMYQNDMSDVGIVTIDWISNGAGTRW